jgi:AhpD family alkylhydroperoxidase
MEREDILNKKERQIVYLGASIASGCLPCTKFHLRRSLGAGLTDIEINKVLAFTISVREHATRSMESFIHNHKSVDNVKEDKQENIKRNNVLVGIAAAYSINFPSSLEKYMSIGRINGISDRELSEIIKISKSVIDMARAHVDMITDKIGVRQLDDNKNDYCRSCDC